MRKKRKSRACSSCYKSYAIKPEQTMRQLRREMMSGNGHSDLGIVAFAQHVVESYEQVVAATISAASTLKVRHHEPAVFSCAAHSKVVRVGGNSHSHIHRKLMHSGSQALQHRLRLGDAFLRNEIHPDNFRKHGFEIVHHGMKAGVGRSV